MKMKKVHVAVVGAKNLDYVRVGTKVELIKDPNHPIDKLAVKCVDSRGNKLGHVSGNILSLHTGISSKELHAKMTNDSIEGTIEFHPSFDLSNGIKKIGLTIGVMIDEENEEGVVDKDMSHSVKILEREVIVKGSLRQYTGKTKVIKAFQQGDTTLVSFKKETDKITTLFQGEPAGEVNLSSNDESVQSLKKGLQVLNEVVGKVIDIKPTTYTVSFKIDESIFNQVAEIDDVNTLQDVKEEVINKVGIEKEELEAIESYLRSNDVSEKHIILTFETYRKYEEDVANRIPKKPETLFKDTFGAVKKSVVYTNKGKHLRLEGEKGTGKNVFVRTLAWIYQRPLFEVSLNSQFDKMDLLGSKSFEQGTTEDGKPFSNVIFEKEAFVEAMEIGAFINLDEVNTVDPSVLVQIHSAVDDRGAMQVPGYGWVEAGQNFGVMLTMNKDYIGTNPLNEATMDRFTPILFPSNKSIIETLRVRVPSAKLIDIQDADKIYQNIFAMVENGQISKNCLTIRGFISALEVAEDLGLKEAIIDNVANRIEDEDYRNYVMNVIDNELA
ncbi:ATPase [Bacillus sp. MYb78]|uniref:ATPase n=2 Tax=Bacillus thuringiensis TaxID=1428 RepID=A0AAP4Q6K0_BACTU|nr:ATPase associated with various cellular activities [Bacillus thuringiensis Bt407]MBN6707658.1 ATPase [Bacillus thuringiensis]PQZ77755.1 ATPase [Bacillus sp. MYb78]MDN7078514.1 ATPase [Bacillus thuringiensis]MDQ7260151.1 ATPase [Bacillus thuringiensis]